MIRVLTFVGFIMLCMSCNRDESSAEISNIEYATIEIDIPFNVLKKDCSDLPSTRSVSFSYTLRDCFSSISFCDFSHIEYLINDDIIQSQSFENGKTPFNPNIFNINYLSLSAINLDDYKNKSELCFTMKVYSKCWLGSTKVFSSKSCVPILTEGQEFTAVEKANEVVPLELDCLDQPMLMICCKEGRNKPMVIETTSSVPKDSISRLTINDEIINLNSCPDVISPSSYVINFRPKSKAFRSGETIELRGVEGRCTSLKPILYYRKVNQNTYLVSSCGMEDVLQESIVVGENLFQIGFRRCDLFDCTH